MAVSSKQSGFLNASILAPVGFVANMPGNGNLRLNPIIQALFFSVKFRLSFFSEHKVARSRSTQFGFGIG